MRRSGQPGRPCGLPVSRRALVRLGCAAPAALAASTSACVPPIRFPRLVKLGLVAPFTRYDVEVGYAAYFGARLAVGGWNQGPYRSQYRVELVTQDDQGTSAGGRLEARKMVLDPDVLVVVGHPTEDAANGATAVYRDGGVPFLALDPGAPGVDGKTSWGVLGEVGSAIQAAVDLLKPQLLDVSTAPPSSDAAVDWLREERGGVLVLGGMVATPTIARLVRPGVPAFVVVPAPVLLPAAEQSFAIPYRASADRREWWFGAVVYDAVRLALQAIGRAIQERDLTRDGVTQALAENLGLDGITGPVRFDASGRRTGQISTLYRLSGEFPGELLATCTGSPVRCVPVVDFASRMQSLKSQLPRPPDEPPEAPSPEPEESEEEPG